MWLPWALWAQRPGLAAQALVFAALYGRNLYRWRNGTMTADGRPAEPGRTCTCTREGVAS